LKSAFLKYLHKFCKYKPGQRVLLAVSGGGDSMAMLHLCQANKLPIGVAHCNFKLRPEADQEEEFVRDYCEQANIPIYIKEIPVAQIKKEGSGQSTQMIARNERYDWFEQVRLEHGFNLVATAHHKNDLAETVINNLARGTGIAGTHGIPQVSKKIIRPLLCFDKNEILDYLSKNQVPFKEDLSNQDTKYQRNYIRHELLPKFEKLNPNYINALSDYSQRIEQGEILLKDVFKKWEKKCKRIENDVVYLNAGLLRNHPSRALILFAMLSKYGFNGKQIQQISDTAYDQSGKQFLTPSHRLVRERNVFTISNIDKPVQSAVEISEDTKEVKCINGVLEIQLLKSSVTILETNERVAFIDKDKLHFPLTWRGVQSGDYFYPLGLRKPNSDKIGKKKLSKYFKDERLSQLEKEASSVLEDDKGRIVWLVGRRLDDRFKVTDQTKEIFLVMFS